MRIDPQKLMGTICQPQVCMTQGRQQERPALIALTLDNRKTSGLSDNSLQPAQDSLVAFDAWVLEGRHKPAR
jgi:hypothetical protein